MGPAVRGLLERYGLSASSVPATGPRGSLLKGDVLNYISRGKLLPIESRLNLNYISFKRNIFI